MRPRQPLPRLWLMTDERQGDGLLPAVARLPAGAGIVFRHYSLAEVARRDLFDRVKAAAPGLVLLAGPAAEARAWGADGSHGPHQGALVDTPSGEHWFLHFQDLGLYGRVVHLNPVTWRDGWRPTG